MKKRLLFKAILLIASTFSISYSYANNIQISNISLLNKNTVENYLYVQFNISWENSWRISSGAQNWDAAWVFIKFRVNGSAWQHATLSTLDTDHQAPAQAVIDAGSDGKGLFLYRAIPGSGTFSCPAVQVKWHYGADGVEDNDNSLEIKVFGIEMVYVNKGSFYIGDGNSFGRFWNADDVNTNPAYISQTGIKVKCEDTNLDDVQIEGDGIFVDGDNGIDTDGSTMVDNPDFPTGYHAFYCMKHEITNEQFAEFLNVLTRAQQNTRTYFDISGAAIVHPFPINHIDHPESRNSVRYTNPGNGIVEPVNFICDLNDNGIGNEADDGQNIPICYMSWADGCAYADWAGLRPMTELEFEKACRGPELPVADEYAWHTKNIYASDTVQYEFDLITPVGLANSYPTNPGTGIYANAQHQFTTGHDTQHDAPLRAGMFATATSDRINAGASYFGILDLSGTMAERCVTVGKIEGRTFQGTNGDGVLTDSPGIKGNASNSDWPGIVSGEESDGVKTTIGSGFRGGDWNDQLSRLRVSYRDLAAEDVYAQTGNIGSGFRCVRTAE